MKPIVHLLSAVTLALPLLAQAGGTFKFDADGGGLAYMASDVGVLDWKPGSALAVGGDPAGGLVNGSRTQLLYQANLGTALDSVGTTVAVSGAFGANAFTVVAGFEEVATVSANTANFALAGVTSDRTKNFFYIYAGAGPGDKGNNLLGTGFSTGTVVMSGYISAVSSSNFSYALDAFGVPVPSVLLDQSPNGNQWGAQRTAVGSGATDLVITIETVNAAYFPDLTPGTKLTTGLLNTSQVDPFNQVDPSRKFSSDGTVATNGTFDAGLCPTNGFNTNPLGGTACNFIFQADANMSIQVPEPGALALVGLALAAAGLVTRRRAA